MATPHYGHTATLLPDGKVLVAGGLIGDGGTASALLYDPSTGTWTATGNMVTPRYFATATLLRNGKVLVAGGGVTSSADTTSAELYDPSTGTWTATGKMARSHTLATATLLRNGKVLVAGGIDNTKPPSTCCGGAATAELYNPSTGTWTATGNMTTPRRDHTATLLPGGKVLVAGGDDGTFTAANGGNPGVLASAELYDPGTGSWTATRNMAMPRVGQTATLLPDGTVLVAGGGGSAALVAELYDPAKGSWTEAGSPPGDVLTATLLPDGTVLVAFCCRHAELYDPGAGSWTVTASQSTDIGDGTTATLLPDGTVLEAGGEGRGRDFASAELYHPASPATSPRSPAPTATPTPPPPRVITGPLPPMPVSRFQNGLIAVSANPWLFGGGQNGDIYLLAEGAAPRRIIGSDGDGIAQACPVFSPDGQRLAYGEARASGPVTTFRGVWPVSERAVVVVGMRDLVDPPILRVTLPPDPGEIACPEWSPDGMQLAFRVGSDLWVADAASGKTTVFPVTGAAWGQHALAWSHDASRIAVAEPGQIQLVRMDGGASTLIPLRGGNPSFVGWTARDDGIVDISADPSTDTGVVNVVEADGKGETALMQTPPMGVGRAAVSPDGSRVAYVPPCESDGCKRVLIMDTDGSNVVDVPVPPNFFVSAVVWSPDYRRLLLSSIDGVISVAVTPGSPAIVYASGNPNGGLNLEWSDSEVTWQPVVH
jgi:Tol biopolymer transport system component